MGGLVLLKAFSVLVLGFLFVTSVRAEVDIIGCEGRLLKQFSRPPKGERGFITDQISLTIPNWRVALLNGIFPWETWNHRGRWFSPPKRGVLFLSEAKFSRKDRQWLRRAHESGDYTVTWDQDFTEVVRQCTKPRELRDEETGKRYIDSTTWISQKFFKTYLAAFEQGLAHSVEVRYRGELVGGLYGLFENGVFSGESMFHTRPDVTKLALEALLNHLTAQGMTVMDVQQVLEGSLMEKVGARLVDREEYLNLIREIQTAPKPFGVPKQFTPSQTEE